MNKIEQRTALSLSSVYALRMFGLFLIVPVFALHSYEFKFATSSLAGIAIGIYGLTQACLQIPMGLLSDRVGRKTVIIAGFLLFCIGSLIAALAETIYGVILGRALQGAGAVASTLMALAADLTREEQRSKINALIGGGIVLAFALALISAPVLHAYVALSGIFWLSALLAPLAILIIVYGVPKVPDEDKISIAEQWQGNRIRDALSDKELLRLYLGVFALHAAMATNFLILPQAIVNRLDLASAEHWIFYLLVLVGSVLLMWPALGWGERKKRVREVFLAAIFLLVLSQLCWYLSDSGAALFIFMLLFFTAFNYLEANLPALLSRKCHPSARGSCMGIFSTAQFLGIFAGATSGGFLVGWEGASIIIPSTFMLFVWFLCALSMKSNTGRHI